MKSKHAYMCSTKLNNTPYKPKSDHRHKHIAKGKLNVHHRGDQSTQGHLKRASFEGLRTTSKHSQNTCKLLLCEAYVEEIIGRMANKTQPSSKYQLSHAIFAMNITNGYSVTLPSWDKDVCSQ